MARFRYLARSASRGEMNYYNEWDPAAAAWLRNLIAAGLLPEGDVDERSIRDIQPVDLAGYAQCHFFAGIGGWPLALAIAGWPPDRAVWSGSCPCQPLSSAGKRQGADDERHLWPDFARLIRECGPPVVFGEQVASADGRRWFAGVRADLEAMGYGVGGADLCAAGVGAPHIRQRLYWVADSNGREREGFSVSEEREPNGPAPGRIQGNGVSQSDRAGGRGGLDNSGHDQRRGRDAIQRAGGESARTSRTSEGTGTERERALTNFANAGPVGGGLGDYSSESRNPEAWADGCDAAERDYGAARATGAWGEFGIVWCDERAFGRGYVPRRVESGSFPLAARLPASVGPGSTGEERLGLVAAKAYRMTVLKGAGNSIVPELAAEFIAAFEEARATSVSSQRGES